jgi:hypothetical protein
MISQRLTRGRFLLFCAPHGNRKMLALCVMNAGNLIATHEHAGDFKEPMKWGYASCKFVTRSRTRLAPAMFTKMTSA